VHPFQQASKEPVVQSVLNFLPPYFTENRKICLPGQTVLVWKKAMCHGSRNAACCCASIAGLLLFLCCPGTNLRAAQSGVEDNTYRVSEVVATLASGRVTIVTAHNGVVVTAVGNQFEHDDLPPLIVPLNDQDLAVVLGAADWIKPPPNQRTLLRLDSQLPRLIQGFAGNAPHLQTGANISNLEKVGLAVLDPLRKLARNLHAQINLPEDLPFAEILLVHQPRDESPTVWNLTYWIHQRFLQENFWDTEIERPRSMQLLPNKENRTGIVEVSYPPDDRTSAIVGWLSQPTGRGAQDIETDSKLAKAQKQIAAGDARKVHLPEMVSIVKAALETTTPTSKAKAMAEIDASKGFSWIIAPPVKSEPKRPAGAPTLNPTPH
jgi:hypothetical protein